jgi:(p)ppGpp synthase/HD superfamily hydrolase
VYAQTNIQLLNQLRREGYALADQEAVAAAYGLAMRLFSARFRPSGKPFVAHLVGVTSILAALHARISVVTCGLLHAVYLQGEFGDGQTGMTEENRAQVRAVVGDDVEALIHDYTLLEWSAATIPALVDGIGQMGARSRDILLVRVANELEDHLDLGVLYCGNADARRAQIAVCSMASEMALALGFPQLAAEMGRVFEEVRSSEVAPSLRLPYGMSVLLPPASFRPRLAKKLPELARRLAAPILAA